MVFQPNSPQTQLNQTQPHQQTFLPPQPMYQVVQSASEIPQPTITTPQHPQQPSFVSPLSSSTTNDEIGELLVAILEEIGNLKQAILTETNDDVEQLLKKEAPALKQEHTEEPDIKPNEENAPKLRTLDFSACF